MKSDILVILMMAFGLFAILMFILFYVYAKKYYNEKKINEDYDLDDDKENDIDEFAPKEDIEELSQNIKNEINDLEEMEFMPKKKKVL